MEVESPETEATRWLLGPKGVNVSVLAAAPEDRVIPRVRIMPGPGGSGPGGFD
jgi:hypothetical protein